MVPSDTSVAWSKKFLWCSFLGNEWPDHGISVPLLCCSQNHEMITKISYLPAHDFSLREFLSACLILGPYSQVRHRGGILLSFTMRELDKLGPRVRWPRPNCSRLASYPHERLFGLAVGGMVSPKCAVLHYIVLHFQRVLFQPSFRSPWEWLGLA